MIDLQVLSSSAVMEALAQMSSTNSSPTASRNSTVVMAPGPHHGVGQIPAAMESDAPVIPNSKLRSMRPPPLMVRNPALTASVDSSADISSFLKRVNKEASADHTAAGALHMPQPRPLAHPRDVSPLHPSMAASKASSGGGYGSDRSDQTRPKHGFGLSIFKGKGKSRKDTASDGVLSSGDQLGPLQRGMVRLGKLQEPTQLSMPAPAVPLASVPLGGHYQAAPALIAPGQPHVPGPVPLGGWSGPMAASHPPTAAQAGHGAPVHMQHSVPQPEAQQPRVTAHHSGGGSNASAGGALSNPAPLVPPHPLSRIGATMRRLEMGEGAMGPLAKAMAERAQ